MEGHWTTKWLGQPFNQERYDCLDFIQEVLRVDFGREIRIPPRWRGSTVRTMVRDIAVLGAEVAVPCSSFPAEGDGVLMRAGGSRLGGHHVGLYATPAGEPHVLHCVEGLGAVIFPVATIGQHGWEVEGYYLWL